MAKLTKQQKRMIDNHNKGQWVNTTKVVTKKIVHPCNDLGYCPYGPLVEAYPLLKKRNQMSCKIFGHNCPVHYLAEFLIESEQ